MELTGAQALIKSLEMQRVEVMFGLPGGAILPVYDPILDSSIRHILVRHEQGAGHMAEGYAQVTGRPGVAMVTSGPGATNIVTPLANAYMDSTPLVVISGQVATAAIGTDAFQESDITGITMGVTKHNWLITDPADIPRVVAEAFHVATTGRPGPVLIDMPKDISNAAMNWYWPELSDLDLPGYHPVTEGDPALVRQAAELLLAAERPVLYVGGGVLKARAAEVLRELAERTGIPVVTTLMARGSFPDSHPLCLGMPGMHGNYTAVTAMQRSDLLIALGSRFDDRVTGKISAFAPEAKIVHVDIDPAEHNKVRRADVAIAGDCRLVIQELLVALDDMGLPHSDATVGHAGGSPSDASPGADAVPGTRAASFPREGLAPWRAQVSEWQRQFPLGYDRNPTGGALKPQFVLEQLRDATPDDTIVASGVGQHQMFASQWWQFDYPYTWVNSGGLGTMGFAVPAAIGAKVGRPDRMVWAVDGDGCFQMTAQELVTASSERIPVKIAILNNAYLGMVRQWQEMFYEERYSEVYLSPDLPDYVGWAESMGCLGLRVESPGEVGPAIDKANDVDDRPVVIDFRTDAFEKVYPMVAAGSSNDDIVVDPEHGQGGR
ncbi:MAG TPA: thiamine pyrophosphate-dependent enzyme [Acidimicrobiales bacterium]|jgi:acetolactate synthase-1/2/3 large subunit